jgi:hypothetical protein
MIHWINSFIISFASFEKFGVSKSTFRRSCNVSLENFSKLKSTPWQTSRIPHANGVLYLIFERSSWDINDIISFNISLVSLEQSLIVLF